MHYVHYVCNLPRHMSLSCALYNIYDNVNIILNVFV